MVLETMGLLSLIGAAIPQKKTVAVATVATVLSQSRSTKHELTNGAVASVDEFIKNDGQAAATFFEVNGCLVTSAELRLLALAGAIDEAIEDPAASDEQFMLLNEIRGVIEDRIEEIRSSRTRAPRPPK